MRLAVALVVVALGACTGSDSRSTTPPTTLNPFASNIDLSSSGAPIAPPPQLVAGNCFDAGSFDAGGTIDSTAVHLVACTDPHQHEAYAVEQQPSGPGAPYPGDPAIAAFASTRCLAAFTAYVGTDYQASSLDTAVVRPDAARWSFGDRSVVCTVHDADFAPLTGSVRGTGR